MSRVRVISREVAEDDIRSYGLTWNQNDILDGGLSGQAAWSFVVIGEDRVWELEVDEQGHTRAYLYMMAEINDHEYVRSKRSV